MVRQLLGRPSEAQFRALGYDYGGEDEAASAKRALFVAYMTIVPNFIVLGIDHKSHLALIHQVSPTKVSRSSLDPRAVVVCWRFTIFALSGLGLAGVPPFATPPLVLLGLAIYLCREPHLIDKSRTAAYEFAAHGSFPARIIDHA